MGIPRQNNMINIYGIYDLNETLVFEGTIKECINFIEPSVTKHAIYKAIGTGRKIRKKYTVEYLFSEKIEGKVCSGCGKYFQINDLVCVKKPNGKIYHRRICHSCHSKLINKYRRKKVIGRNISIYAAYNNKGQEFARGTSDELSKILNISKEYLINKASIDKKKKYNYKNAKYIIKNVGKEFVKYEL